MGPVPPPLESSRLSAIVALAVAGVAISAMIAGAAAREAFLVIGGYGVLVLALGRSRSLLRSIDAGDLANDGRRYAFFAWFLSMVGSAMAVLALLRAVLP